MTEALKSGGELSKLDAPGFAELQPKLFEAVAEELFSALVPVHEDELITT